MSDPTPQPTAQPAHHHTPRTLTGDQLISLEVNRRRRYILYYFSATDGTDISLDALATQIRDWERTWDDDDTTPPADHLIELKIELHHNHLPRIADMGVIEYNPCTQTIRNADRDRERVRHDYQFNSDSESVRSKSRMANREQSSRGG